MMNPNNSLFQSELTRDLKQKPPTQIREHAEIPDGKGVKSEMNQSF